MPSVSTTPTSIPAKINENGRIVIPVALRQEMGVKAGDTVLLKVEGGVLSVESFQARIRRVQERMRVLIPEDRCLSDELIADRREEARREMAELDATVDFE